MINMQAGKLTEKIQFYSPYHQKTEYGSKTKTTYTYAFSTRATYKYTSGQRVNQNDEIFFDSNHSFIVRYYVPVEEEMRIKYDDKTYRILSIEPNKTRREKTINVEVVNE